MWTIDAKDQSAIVQANLPDRYSCSDQYGLATETHVVAAKLAGVSKVASDGVGFGHTVSDILTVSLNQGGVWSTIGG